MNTEDLNLKGMCGELTARCPLNSVWHRLPHPLGLLKNLQLFFCACCKPKVLSLGHLRVREQRHFPWPLHRSLKPPGALLVLQPWNHQFFVHKSIFQCFCKQQQKNLLLWCLVPVCISSPSNTAQTQSFHYTLIFPLRWGNSEISRTCLFMKSVPLVPITFIFLSLWKAQAFNTDPLEMQLLLPFSWVLLCGKILKGRLEGRKLVASFCHCGQQYMKDCRF